MGLDPCSRFGFDVVGCSSCGDEMGEMESRPTEGEVEWRGCVGVNEIRG